MEDKLSIKGEVHIKLTDSNGNIKDERVFPNLVTTAGKGFITSRMASASAAVMGWIEVGTSSTTPAVGDTALGSASFRKAVTVSGGTPSGNTLTFATTLSAGEGTATLQEAGIFNQVTTGGTMLARTTFSPIVKAAGDTLAITWVITVN